MVSWLSDRVQNIRETLGIAPTIFIEILILFFMEKVLVAVAGHILKATVTWWAAPSRLGTRPKPTAKNWEEIWWRSTVKKKTSLYWSWLTSALRHCIWFGWHWSGVEPAKKSVYLGWQLNSDIPEMVSRWAKWKCSWTMQQLLDQEHVPWNKRILEWHILFE